MTTQIYRDEMAARFKARPSYQSAASFSREVGVHYTTMYKWVREYEGRVKSNQPVRSEGYKAIESTIQSVRYKLNEASKQRDQLTLTTQLLSDELSKLQQALSLLS